VTTGAMRWVLLVGLLLAVVLVLAVWALNAPG
jgi:hypothetical protein